VHTTAEALAQGEAEIRRIRATNAVLRGGLR
jgi:hypothetical protein